MSTPKRLLQILAINAYSSLLAGNTLITPQQKNPESFVQKQSCSIAEHSAGSSISPSPIHTAERAEDNTDYTMPMTLKLLKMAM